MAVVCRPGLSCVSLELGVLVGPRACCCDDLGRGGRGGRLPSSSDGVFKDGDSSLGALLILSTVVSIQDYLQGGILPMESILRLASGKLLDFPLLLLN